MSTLELVKLSTQTGTYKRKEINLPTFSVRLDGVELGRVWRGFVTHERRTKGNRYVNARWQSPGWFWTGGWDTTSRREAIERLLKAKAGLRWTDAEDLAATVRGVR